MKRVLFAFFGTLICGLVLFALVSCFQAIPSPRLFGEAIGFLAVLFAVAAGLDGKRRRAANGTPGRCGDGKPSVLPQPANDGGGHSIVFRPQRTPILIGTLIPTCLAVGYILALGIYEPVRLFGGLQIPGPAVVGPCLFGAAVYLVLLIRSCLPGREIVVDASGIILPGRRRVTWDQITEVKLCNAGSVGFLAILRIGLNDGRRIHLRSYQTGCELRRLYAAIQACFEQHAKRAEVHGQSREPQDAVIPPPVGVHPR